MWFRKIIKVIGKCVRVFDSYIFSRSKNRGYFSNMENKTVKRALIFIGQWFMQKSESQTWLLQAIFKVSPLCPPPHTHTYSCTWLPVIPFLPFYLRVMNSFLNENLLVFSEAKLCFQRSTLGTFGRHLVTITRSLGLCKETLFGLAVSSFSPF